MNNRDSSRNGDRFCYLDSMITREEGISQDVKAQIKKYRQAFTYWNDPTSFHDRSEVEGRGDNNIAPQGFSWKPQGSRIVGRSKTTWSRTTIPGAKAQGQFCEFVTWRAIKCDRVFFDADQPSRK